jgi:hypothetical protein
MFRCRSLLNPKPPQHPPSCVCEQPPDRSRLAPKTLQTSGHRAPLPPKPPNTPHIMLRATPKVGATSRHPSQPVHLDHILKPPNPLHHDHIPKPPTPPVQVHGIHDLMFEGTPEIGAAWLRQQPLAATWQRLVLVPVGGGVLVGGLNYAREFLSESGATAGASEAWQRLTGAAKPVLKAVAAAVTLGTGNSLGPEGPSVEIGASVAGGLGTLLKNSRERTLALVAAGSAAGISSGERRSFFSVRLRPFCSLSPTFLTSSGHHCLN